MIEPLQVEEFPELLALDGHIVGMLTDSSRTAQLMFHRFEFFSWPNSLKKRWLLHESYSLYFIERQGWIKFMLSHNVKMNARINNILHVK